MHSANTTLKTFLFRAAAYFILVFALLATAFQLYHSFRGHFFGPYGDEWEFVSTITKVSYGVDVFHELFKYEGDYRHIFTKLIWAGNYIFANGTNLFTSCLVVFFLLLYTIALGVLLLRDQTLNFNVKLTIFSIFMLANFGGISVSSIGIPVLGTWPIVLSSLFLGLFFIVRAAQQAAIEQPQRMLKVVFNIFLAHFFGAIALATFGHGFLYFGFFALALWVYQQNIKTIVLYSLPGFILTILYMHNYHSIKAAMHRLNNVSDFLLNLPYYFFRLLADPFYFLTHNYSNTALIGAVSFILLGFLVWPFLNRNKLFFKQNALCAVLISMLAFTLLGCMLGIFGRYAEVNTLYPYVPGRFGILVDALWASAASLAIIRFSVRRQLFLAIIFMLGCSLLVARQFQWHVFEFRSNYYPNIVQVEQAIGLHNGYLPQLDIAQWANCNKVEMTERKRGIGGFALKERLLLGLNIDETFTVLPSDECGISDVQKPKVKFYDHLTDAAFALYGTVKHNRRPRFSSVVLITNAKNNIVGFGFTGNEVRNRFGQVQGKMDYYAVSPWHQHEAYRSYLMTQDREKVCLLNEKLNVPEQYHSLLPLAIAPLHYAGKKNEYLFFFDDRMQIFPHFLGYFNADYANKVTPYKDEKIPFDAHVSTMINIIGKGFNGGISLPIPEDMAARLMGHKIKIKLLLKQAADFPSKEAALRIDTNRGEGELITFVPQKNWHVVEFTYQLPAKTRGRDFIRFWANTNNDSGAIIFRAGMLVIP